MKTIECVIDTFTWIEYFRQTRLGQPAAAAIESGRGVTPAIVIAELSVIFIRDRLLHWERDLKFLQAKTVVAELSVEIAAAAGRIRELMRAAHRGAGLADAIVYETARARAVPVLTGDPHFKGLPHVLFLE